MVSNAVLDRAMEQLAGAHRYEKYVAAMCPFHQDRSPSLLVYPDGYVCTACGARGPLERLWKQAGLRPLSSFEDQPDYRPEVYGMSKTDLVWAAHRYLRNSKGHADYLNQRGFTTRTIRRYKLGYWDGWYVIPSYSQTGDLKAVYFRSGPLVQRLSGIRFYQLKGQGGQVYCPDWGLLNDAKGVFVVYGLFDAITLAQLHYPVVTPTTGKASFRADWLDWFEGKVTVVPDSGEEKEAYLLASRLGWRGHVLLLDYPEGVKDPNDFVKTSQTTLLQEQLDETLSR
jgi:hypothetical protein